MKEELPYKFISLFYPTENALYHKDHGNEKFKEARTEKKRWKRDELLNEAIDLYTRGLEKRCPDRKINATLHCNRAAVNLLLGRLILWRAFLRCRHVFSTWLSLTGNRRKVVADCCLAVKLDPSNIKAYYRATKALAAVER